MPAESMCQILIGSFFLCVLRLNDKHPKAKVSEEVNRTLPARNIMVWLSTPYTDPECHNAQRFRQR